MNKGYNKEMRGNKIIKEEIIKKLVVAFVIFFFELNYVVADEIGNSTDSIKESFNIDSYIDTINEYVNDNTDYDIDISKIAEELVSTEGLDYKGIIVKMLLAFFNEITTTIKSTTSILIIIVIMALLSSLDLEEKGDITNIARLVCFIAIATITIMNFIDIMSMFKKVVSSITTVMQVVSPFLMSILIATGKVSSTGIIQPLLLFISSFIGFLVNYAIFPFFTVSVALNIISNMSDSIRFDKMSKFFSSSAIWITGVFLTIFLGVLSLEGSLSSSVDSLAVKTTQTALSSFVPVVGKFFSDSFETVVGATKIIGKVGGFIGIISMVIISAVPVLKILSITVIYYGLVAITEPICSDEKISKYLGNFADMYKNLLGILIGIVIVFVIATGVTLNLISVTVS